MQSSVVSETDSADFMYLFIVLSANKYLLLNFCFTVNKNMLKFTSGKVDTSHTRVDSLNSYLL